MFMLALKISAVGSADDPQAYWAHRHQGLRELAQAAFSALGYHVFTFIFVRRGACSR